MAEAIGISRRSLPNWRDKPDSIKALYRFNIDVLYCKHFLIPAWDMPGQSFVPVLLPDDFSGNEALLMPFLRRLSYGTIEIETDMSKDDFERAIDAEKLPKNMSRQTFHEAVNTYFMLKWLWQKTVEHVEPFEISEDHIKSLHAYFIAIHPFGDGNGRVGRTLVTAQCLNTGLMPPLFDGENRAMYYAAIEHAMLHGRYTPLVRLFHASAQCGKPD